MTTATAFYKKDSASMEAAHQLQPEGHIPELDAIRGLAALAVLACHLPRGFWFGETGVDLFFVLSGYLISSIILKTLDKPNFFKTFYMRRSLRIFPIYYLAIIMVVTLNMMRQNPQASEGLWAYFLYLQNTYYYFNQSAPQMELPIGHTWTLAIEEQFYLLWPFLLYYLRSKKMLAVCIVLSVAPFFLREAGLDRSTLFGHTDGLAMGGVLAYILSRPIKFSRNQMTWAFVSLFVVALAVYWLVYLLTDVANGKAYINHHSASIVYISLAYLGLIGAIVINSGHRWLSWLRQPVLMKMGMISYGLYLYHWIVYEWLDTVFVFRFGFDHPLWLDGLKIFISFAVAVASWLVVEKPLLKLKDHFRYQTTQK